MSLYEDLEHLQVEAEQHTQAYDDAAVLRVVAFTRAVLEVSARAIERQILEGEPTGEVPTGIISTPKKRP